MRQVAVLRTRVPSGLGSSTTVEAVAENGASSTGVRENGPTRRPVLEGSRSSWPLNETDARRTPQTIRRKVVRLGIGATPPSEWIQPRERDATKDIADPLTVGGGSTRPPSREAPRRGLAIAWRRRTRPAYGIDLRTGCVPPRWRLSSKKFHVVRPSSLSGSSR